MQKELLEINIKDKGRPYVRDIVRDEILLNMIFNTLSEQFELLTFEFLNNPNDLRNSPSFRKWALKWKN